MQFKRAIIHILTITALLLYVINYSYNNNYRQLNNNTNHHLIIESECSCKQNERIQIIKEQEKNTYQVYINNQFKYSINNRQALLLDMDLILIK